MSARTLRLLVSLLIVGGIFIYIASVQVSDNLPLKAPDEGQPGGPIAGLTKRQLERFYRCKETFRKVFGVQDGLGPLYNESSCASCHSSSSTDSGAAVPDVPKTIYMAKRNSKSKFADKPIAEVRDHLQYADLDFLENEGGPVLLRKSITDQLASQLAELQVPRDCKCPAMAKPPADAEIISKRIALPLYGLGLIDAIPDLTIANNARIQKFGKSSVKGQTAQSQVELVGFSEIGKFGAKGSETNLVTVCAKELATHLGLSNPIYQHTSTTSGVDKTPDCLKTVGPPDPNTDMKVIAQLVYYLSLLAPPVKQKEPDKQAVAGEAVFTKLGCAECHLPMMKTGPKVFVIDPDANAVQLTQPITADKKMTFEFSGESNLIELRVLESIPVYAYTDLLVHDMGANLADGFAPTGTGSGAHWKTAPLWGLRDKRIYLHDGRASTVEAAITMHGGEASNSVKEYNKLSKEQKDSLKAFLQSL